MTTPLTIVPDTKESRMARLKRDWQALATQQDARSVDGDVSRAELLAQGVADGLTQQEMAEGLGLKQQHISYLLRFHRFNTTQSCIKISEGRFRQYWQQMARLPRGGGRLPSDPVKAAFVKRQRENQRDEEEQRVFRQIAAWITQDKAPIKPPKAEKPPPSADRLEASRNFKANIRKEVTRICSEEIEPHVRALQELAAIDHPMRTNPEFIASHARRLQRAMEHLRTFLEEETTRKKTRRPSQQRVSLEV